eukprot:scaffold216153_cov32-Prasinocladus_malaysianus.AAC.1
MVAAFIVLAGRASRADAPEELPQWGALAGAPQSDVLQRLSHRGGRRVSDEPAGMGEAHIISKRGIISSTFCLAK